MSNISELVGDFTNPILKPEAAEVVKQHGELGGHWGAGAIVRPDGE